MGLYFRLTRHNPARSFRLTERRRDPSEPSSRNHIPDHPIGGQGQIRQSCDERTQKCCRETWLSLDAIATLINGTSMGWMILPCRYMCGNFEHVLLKDAGTSEIIPIKFREELRRHMQAPTYRPCRRELLWPHCSQWRNCEQAHGRRESHLPNYPGRSTFGCATP